MIRNIFWVPVLHLVAVILVAPIAEGVFIASDTPNANTSAPVDDRGWTSSAVYNDASAVYLKDGWFITSRHIGIQDNGTVSIGGSSYAIDSASWTSITNSNGTNADIRLFRISNPSELELAGTEVISSSLSLGQGVTMIGYGRNVSSVVTNNYDEGAHTEIRYYEGSTSSMKWGENEIAGFEQGFTEQTFGFTSDVFWTELATGKAQALQGDSGGGVFVYDSERAKYVLAGIMIGAGLRKDVDEKIYAYTDTGTPNSITISLDLRSYADQINQTIPEPSAALFLLVAGSCIWLRKVYRRRLGVA